MNSIQISAEARRWRDALEIGAREVVRLIDIGISQSELDHALETITRVYRQKAESHNTTMSQTFIDNLIECAESGNVFVSGKDVYQIIERAKGHISREMVNERIKTIFGYFRDAVAGEGEAALFISMPEGGEQGEHMESFTKEAAQEALLASLEGVDEYLDTSVLPEFLIPDEHSSGHNQNSGQISSMSVDENIAFAPQGASVTTDGQTGNTAVLPPFKWGGPECERTVDSELDLTMLKLRNGIRVTCKKTVFDEKEAQIYVNILGGRAAEGTLPRQTTGAAGLGMEIATQSGIGSLGPSALNSFCSLHQISVDGGCASENLWMDVSFSTRNEGNVRRAVEICLLFLMRPKCESSLMCVYVCVCVCVC